MVRNFLNNFTLKVCKSFVPIRTGVIESCSGRKMLWKCLENANEGQRRKKEQRWNKGLKRAILQNPSNFQ